MAFFIRAMIFLLSSFGSFCFAASSILVWPIYQVIESDENSSALWLENKGNAPVGLQIRIMSWKQIDFQDRYAEQRNVIATPPFMTLEPGKRNMIRLIRVNPIPANTEQAYRIIIDEISTPYQKDAPQMGLQFQMRYLLPLFLDGEGIWTHSRPDKRRTNVQPTLPLLSWRISALGGKSYLYVRNRGLVHARLSNVYWSADPSGKGSRIKVTDGFLGYVLPGQEMRWPLPTGISTPGAAMQLFTHLIDITDPILIKRE
ncbi:molecular chaperone [Pectobacterium actinidiae]|uniref:Molecular chaperone n=1 Tax=Pectobacterium actinidiae TaxID=1507808 RepID=A0A1V2R6C6_9GAMM|nr:molecular chaperone [Pectobacterium actinidiae]GLW38403.1 pili assembly chaperone [Pectobacterium carotovorum subsp. carotovorum]MDY4314240.1 molecular chaperone [Pectobacterium actinidiae]ONK05645.1 molecular chaperone [Pectobacterium actinidiae]ONK07987.1 molecular chaperone [Pectobacterium actinidiae]WEF10826.1 molecular chaperone [Pectobacterium actinidiae]